MNELLDTNINFKVASNILLGEVSAYLNKTEKTINDTTLTKERFIELVNKMDDGTLTSKNMKDIIDTIMESTDSIEDIMKSSGVQNITDDSMIKDVINKIVEANPESVADYKAGHDRAIKYLMGQVMKETKGTVNPKMAMDILIETLK